MKIKGKVKKEVLADLSSWEKIHAAEYGQNDSPEARAFVDAIDSALMYKAIYKQEKARRKHLARQHYDREVAYILCTLGERFKSRDSAFFRAVADALATWRKAVDPVRAFVGTQIESSKAFALPAPTIAELQEWLRRLGYPEDQISDRQLRRIYTEDYKEKPTPGLVGRPPKSRSPK